jgi:alpha-D-xyloside xylohydrolase
MKRMPQKLFTVASAILFVATATEAHPASATILPVPALQRQADGVMLKTEAGTLRLQVWSERILRVTFAPGTDLPKIKSYSVTAKPEQTKWKLKETPDAAVLETAAIRALVDKKTGAVGFSDLNGRPVLQEAENGREFSPSPLKNIGGTSVQQKFILPPDEWIYGLGQHQGGVWNYRGATVRLQQRNMEVGLPVLVSSKGYGLLWDNPAITDVDVGKANGEILSWNSEAGTAVDYYFLFGPAADDVIRGYRELTGAAPLMPKWLWGFWQCKERYQTQAEMTGIVAKYRQLGVPLDGIIQDWQYWKPNGWGSHEFDPARYPNPAAMVKDLHAMNAHVLISVWPKFDLGLTNLAELEQAGAVYSPVLPSVYPKGQQKWYDPFSPAGRKIYWQQLSQHLFRLGFDGWWLDASEAEFSGKWGEFRAFKTAAGPGAEVFNAYPLLHTTGIHQGQRAQTGAKRVVILTRSAYAGQQRNAAITWSGDIHGNWTVFARQIPAGLNFSVSGIPYWNTDIGGFFSGNPTNKNYQELFTRWFQFGAFNPMFRVHGSGNGKELWLWDEPTQKILADYIRLRYRLLPYIYSTAWQVTDGGGTMLRPLMMDFMNDTNALDVGDQFLFGPGILVSPVTQSNAITRSVYLPGRGDWHDFWTGKRMAGGQRIEAAAPIETLPLFVRAGTILPLSPVVQYVSEKPADPVELRVYRGADGAFTLYEDEGDNFHYEKGGFATIPLTWCEAGGTLTIGARRGKFPGMLKERTFRVVLVDEGHGIGGQDTEPPDAIVKYAGKAITIRLPPKTAAP